MTFVYKLLVICLSIASLVDAHAYLVDPPSGQQLQNKAGVEYCPHCYNGGGTGTVQGLTPAGEWPFGSWPLAYGEYKETDATAVRHGLCGDAANGASLYEPGDARNVGRTTHKTYTAGEVVEFTVGVSTHHRGHYEFRLCELQEGEQLTQSCLNEHVLQRADDDSHISPIDPVHPERYYLEPQCAENTKGLTAADIAAASSFNVHTFHYMKYQIPSTVACDFCIIQWYYVTANSCNPPGYKDRYDRGDWPTTYSHCSGDGPNLGWYAGPDYQSCTLRYPEEFWGCANVRVLADGEVGPSPSPTATPNINAQITATPSPSTLNSPNPDANLVEVDLDFTPVNSWNGFCTVSVSVVTPIALDGWMLMLRGFTPQGLSFQQIWNAEVLAELSTSNEIVARNIPAYNDGVKAPGDTITFGGNLQVPGSSSCARIQTAFLYNVGGTNSEPENNPSTCSAESITCVGTTELVDRVCCAVPNTCGSSTSVACSTEACCQPTYDELSTCASANIACGDLARIDTVTCCKEYETCAGMSDVCNVNTCCEVVYDNPSTCSASNVDCGSDLRLDYLTCCNEDETCAGMNPVCSTATCCVVVADDPSTCLDANVDCADDIRLDSVTCCDTSASCDAMYTTCSAALCCTKVFDTPVLCANAGLDCGDKVPLDGEYCCGVSLDCESVDRVCSTESCCEDSAVEDTAWFEATHSVMFNGVWNGGCNVKISIVAPIAMESWVIGFHDMLPSGSHLSTTWNTPNWQPLGLVQLTSSSFTLSSANVPVSAGETISFEGTMQTPGSSSCVTLQGVYIRPGGSADTPIPNNTPPTSGGDDDDDDDDDADGGNTDPVDPSVYDTPTVIDNGELQSEIECFPQCKWQSVGGQIRANGQDVNIKGTSWFGFETHAPKAPHGCDSQGHTTTVECWIHNFNFMSSSGFNALRIPLAMDGILANVAVPQSPYFGMTTLAILDEMIEYAGRYGIVVMLDLHVINPDLGLHTDLWYDPAVHDGLSGTQHVVNVIDVLLERYQNTWNVFALDIYNEPHGAASWGDGVMQTDWHMAATVIANHIITHTVHTNNMLVFVEGVGNGNVPGEDLRSQADDYNHWWGGNMEGVRDRPVLTDDDSRVVYSPHVYGPDVYMQDYFSNANYPSNLPQIYDIHFGFITERAVVIGEWGGRYDNDADRAFQNTLARYMNDNNMVSNFYWCLNANSGDTGGLWASDWSTPDYDKLDMIASIYNGKTLPPKFKYSVP